MFCDMTAVVLFLNGKYSQLHGWGLVYEFHRGDKILLCSAKELSMTASHIILKLSFKLFHSPSRSPFYLCAISYNSAEALLKNDLQTL